MYGSVLSVIGLGGSRGRQRSSNPAGTLQPDLDIEQSEYLLLLGKAQLVRPVHELGLFA